MLFLGIFSKGFFSFKFVKYRSFIKLKGVIQQLLWQLDFLCKFLAPPTVVHCSAVYSPCVVVILFGHAPSVFFSRLLPSCTMWPKLFWVCINAFWRYLILHFYAYWTKPNSVAHGSWWGNEMKRFGRGVSIYLFQSFMRSPLIHLTLFHSLGVLLLCNNVLVSVFLNCAHDSHRKESWAAVWISLTPSSSSSSRLVFPAHILSISAHRVSQGSRGACPKRMTTHGA